VNVPLSEPLFDARSTLSARTAVIVRVDTENPDVVGWGEAAAFGGVESAVVGLVEHFAPLIIGREIEPRSIAQDLLHVSAHYRGGIAISAISGIEIALWDALGKLAGMPVCRLLGVGPACVPTYRTLGFFVGPHPDASLDRLRRDLDLVADQDVGVKVKIGRFGVADDIRRAEIARHAIGDDRRLIVDANNAYDLAGARTLCRALDGLEVVFVEEPIAYGHPAASAELRATVPTRIAGYELDADYIGCHKYIAARAVDYVQPDAIWSGGIAECLAIADSARRNGIEIIPHNFATAIGTAANYHLATAAGSPMLELDGTGSPLGDSLLLGSGWTHDLGCLELVDGTGLGVPDPRSWLKEIGNG
jgi:L-alanine-DL-glutamate epimerase-like enolase superfamily enzyme